MATIFIPKKLNVGYQDRKGTYTGRLAYIIYYDAKGKLRKESSWNSWRDEKIDNQEFSNEPIEGFVLNKKAGDYKSDWSHRQAYSRVYDPRGFEFEITIDNLLYILENTDCIRGKGLVGKFVYGWEGTELVLIPESASEYKNHMEFSDLLVTPQKVHVKDLKAGATYRTNKNEEVVYLGRYSVWSHKYVNPDTGEDVSDRYDYSYRTTKKVDWDKGPHFYFYNLNAASKYEWRKPNPFLIMKSISGRIVQTISSDPVGNYAMLMDELERYEEYVPYDPSRDEYVLATLEELQLPNGDSYYGYSKNVYFTIDGIELCGRLNKVCYEYGPNGREKLSNNKVSIHDWSRRKPLPSVFKKNTYSNGGYWAVADDPEVEAIKEKYSNFLRKDSSHNYPRFNLEDLHDQFQFKIKKEYLRNGKERNK